MKPEQFIKRKAYDFFFLKMKVEKQKGNETEGELVTVGCLCYFIYMLRITDLFETTRLYF